jgi:hypothetical protein
VGENQGYGIIGVLQKNLGIEDVVKEFQGFFFTFLLTCFLKKKKVPWILF